MRTRRCCPPTDMPRERLSGDSTRFRADGPRSANTPWLGGGGGAPQTATAARKPEEEDKRDLRCRSHSTRPAKPLPACDVRPIVRRFGAVRKFDGGTAGRARAGDVHIAAQRACKVVTDYRQLRRLTELCSSRAEPVLAAVAILAGGRAPAARARCSGADRPPSSGFHCGRGSSATADVAGGRSSVRGEWAAGRTPARSSGTPRAG